MPILIVSYDKNIQSRQHKFDFQDETPGGDSLLVSDGGVRHFLGL